MPTNKNPSDFNGSQSLILIEMFSTGATLAEFLVKVGISKKTFYQWVKKYPMFSDAYDKADLEAEAYWRRFSRERVTGMQLDSDGNPHSLPFDSKFYNLMMGQRFGDRSARAPKVAKFNKNNVGDSSRALVDEVKQGNLTTKEFKDLSSGLTDVANVIEKTEVVERLEKVEQELESAKQDN